MKDLQRLYKLMFAGRYSGRVSGCVFHKQRTGSVITPCGSPRTIFRTSEKIVPKTYPSPSPQVFPPLSL